MSFFGGGTDFPGFYEKHGGSVISATFDKYCYVSVRHLPRFFEYKTHLTYSGTEYVNVNDEIKHPAIREAMKYLDMHELRLTYDSDLPARSGLGTSSSFAVGMLNAFYALKGKYKSKRELADDAILLERVLCGEAGGIQDQIAAAFGGLNRIDFSATGYEVNPIVLSKERKEHLSDNLILFFTGFSRYSSEIQETFQQSVDKNEKELIEMVGLVDEAESILTSKTDLSDFGRLLDHTWQLKRGMSEQISTDAIDHWYKKARDAGALGGKLLGAGGGGFLLFYVDQEQRDAVCTALSDLLEVPFDFENQGTNVVHYAPEEFVPEDLDA
jgi:D-glycero-alpha-D-manno-heptose-7-phosphate kinase